MLEIFIVLAISYLIGNIKIKGISFGYSAIILVALVFGHFGISVSNDIKNLGLLLFVCAIGLSSGPTFISHFKANAKSYIFNGFLIVLIAGLITALITMIFSLDIRLALGLFTGALTSTPGFAIASELSNSSMTTAAYGISYPFGVICVTLFCQFMSRNINNNQVNKKENKTDLKTTKSNKYSLLNYSIAMVLGILIGKIKLPLLGGFSFSFGNSGGPLIAGIILGSIGSIGRYSLSVDDNILKVLKDFGLSLFLLASGLQAGQDILTIIKEYGILLLILGALITAIPMLISYFLSLSILKLPLINTLGSICGGMTSTPALGALSQNVEDDSVLSSYAATYPIALICVILFSQLLFIIFS